MLFTSTIFLYFFLPAVLLCYYIQRVIAGNSLRNCVLLLFSFLFYLYGAGGFLLFLIASIAVDFFLGLLIEYRKSLSRLWVALSVTINVGFLIFFKYAGFFLDQLSIFLSLPGLSAMPEGMTVVFPLGISFFTFQKLSYIIDVHRGQARALTRPSDFALYVAMFPQLVAGPIVRFKDIHDQLGRRLEAWKRFYSGILRFCWGLSKKVLIADGCGRIADAVFGSSLALLDTKTAWLGALAYTYQIYFDFSAYSDMAIGLARLFGFELPENFNRPYAAVNMTDFWRRWHISLSNWFRDYLYIPLGGNQKGHCRTGINLFLVFGLCGLWHGAHWTFVVWGFYHGFFLVLDRLTGLRNFPDQYGYGYAFRRLVTFLVIVFGWVLFRSETLSGALDFLHVMVVPVNAPLPFELSQVLNHRNIFFMLIAAVSTLMAHRLFTIEDLIRFEGPALQAASIVLVFIVLPYCFAFILAGQSHPFIYFRF